MYSFRFFLLLLNHPNQELLLDYYHIGGVTLVDLDRLRRMAGEDDEIRYKFFVCASSAGMKSGCRDALGFHRLALDVSR